MTEQEAKQLAKDTLSPKRYHHVAGVAEVARQLARLYGEDEGRAGIAAWLHDIVKEKPAAGLLQLMGLDAIMAGSTQARPQPIWHGPCAAIYAKHMLGVQDEELLDALCCHTTGRADMTLLDKILLVADRTSPEREYPGVETIREAAKTDLDLAVKLALERSIAYVENHGGDVDAGSAEALASLKQTRPDLFI